MSISTPADLSGTFGFWWATLEVAPSPDGRERECFLAWLPDLIKDPEKAWLVPMKRVRGRRVVFRQRYLKAYRYGRQRNLIFVAEFHRGVLVGFTFIETRYTSYLQNLRKGFLRHAREQ